MNSSIIDKLHIKQSSFYLFLYTLLGSLFLLLSILAMSSIMSTTDFDTLFKGNFIYLTQLFLFYGIFIAFAVKTPTIFLNTLLLKAHVEWPYYIWRLFFYLQHYKYHIYLTYTVCILSSIIFNSQTNMSFDFGSFLRYYSENVLLDLDNTVYSSGGGDQYYDAVFDTYKDKPQVEPEIPQKDTAGSSQEQLTHTQELANYLKTASTNNGAKSLKDANIHFQLIYTNTNEEEYMSKIAIAVKNENPLLFRKAPNAPQSLIKNLVPALEALNKNYNI